MKQPTQINKAKTLPEIFQDVGKLESTEDKIKLLSLYKSRQMEWLINGIYNVDWSEMKVPKFKPSNRPAGNTNGTIGTSINRLEQAYRFRKDKPEATQRLLSLVLEEISSDESTLLLNMFSGKKKIDGVSKIVLRTVFPKVFEKNVDDEKDQ